MGALGILKAKPKKCLEHFFKKRAEIQASNIFFTICTSNFSYPKNMLQMNLLEHLDHLGNYNITQYEASPRSQTSNILYMLFSAA